MACRSLQEHGQIYDRAQAVARGHRSHTLIDQFVICAPNGWGTAVVGLDGGTAGRILMPPRRCVCVVTGLCASSQRNTVASQDAYEQRRLVSLRQD